MSMEEPLLDPLGEEEPENGRTLGSTGGVTTRALRPPVTSTEEEVVPPGGCCNPATLLSESEKPLPPPSASLEPSFSTSEFKALLRLCLPVALATICRLSIFSTDSVFVGNLPNGTDALGGLTTASNVLTICGQTFVFSYGYVLNSICAQAIGAGNPKLAGGWLQVSLVSVTVLTIPVLV